MSEIEKTILAVNLVLELLGHDKKILAIKLTRMIYKCGLVNAKKFVDSIEYAGSCVEVGTLRKQVAELDTIEAETKSKLLDIYDKALAELNLLE